MLLRTYGVVSLWGTVALMFSGGTADAQWVAASGNPCACTQTVQAVQPVVQNCYQQIPVVEYQQVRQTVKKPVIETAYIDQPVTTYRPVTETRVAEIPTVTYQDVTECQVVQRDASFVATRYEPNLKLSPCQYDPRPTFMGWLNRTSYGIRSMFTPNYTMRQEIVPNVITEVVPVTRKVAIPGTRQVTYNVTHMVAEQTTRKVAVNTVRYEDTEVVALQPVTTMKTVHVGSRVALAPLGITNTMTVFGALPSRTALQPVPDAISAARKSDATRSAAAPGQYDEGAPEEYKRSAEGEEQEIPARRSSLEKPVQQPELTPPTVENKTEKPSLAVSNPSNLPSIVKMHRWVARTPVSQTADRPVEVNVARTEP